MPPTPPIGDEEAHPRPQLRRPWIDLSGTWGFAYDDDDVGGQERWVKSTEAFDRSIEVPFPPESKLSGIGDGGFHPVIWYRRTFAFQPAPGNRLLLHFGAVDYRASVWVNGGLVVEHEGGHTPFSADITDVLKPEGEQTVVVRAEDLPSDLGQPRGKQDWRPEPHSIWYGRTSGIWQPVWLEEVPAARIDAVHWTPVPETAAIQVMVRTAQMRPGLRLRIRLSLRGDVLADDDYAVTQEEMRRTITLSKPWLTVQPREVLWTPEHPHLIDAALELYDGTGLVDAVASYTAMRSVRVSAGRFQLNGRPYFLRLVLEQGYWPESHLATPSQEALQHEVKLIKSFGFNGVRMHQKISDPRFLYWCDRLGLLVWGEMPAAYEFSSRTTGRLTREWLEVLERDRSHPCVIAWVPFNESWGVPNLPTSAAQRSLVRAMYFLTKSIDPSRPVVGNDGWEQVVADITTVHDYTARGSTLQNRYGTPEAVDETLTRVQPSYRSVLLPGTSVGEQPVMITEFGGITLSSAIRGQVWAGYGAEPDVESFVNRYAALVDALLDSPSITGFCYTQLTDTVQEQNGLVTEEREPKVAPERIRAINCRTSAAVPADDIFVFQVGDYPAPLGDRVEQAQASSPGPNAE
ncbi:MAG TPA: glycoside hydrolase family 2 TIM barrel-domain containing protein [Propionibacteriaceae bacterium]|nr:glycoside hydrolase family 2 TIM barrel-domain containing protein [Propionibacteriaceae bacterium]